MGRKVIRPIHSNPNNHEKHTNDNCCNIDEKAEKETSAEPKRNQINPHELARNTAVESAHKYIP